MIFPRISEESFSVRYFKETPECQNLLSIIEKYCVARQKEKEREKLQSIEEYQQTVRQYIQMQCNCRWVTGLNRYRRQYNFLVQCSRCKIKDQADEMTIDYYSKLLPSKLEIRYAIVYEILQPIPLACQRDAFGKFFKTFGAKEFENEDVQSQLIWKDEDRLCSISYQCRKGGTRLIQLGSTSKPFTRTHYNCTKRVSWIDSDTNLIKENGCNAVLISDGNLLKDIRQWVFNTKEYCSINLSNESPYKNLERLFDSWTADENEILANKNQAHKDISIREFIAAGNLRTGICHQLIRLLNSISQMSISFEKEEIVTLIMWTLYQAGPSNSETKHDNHRDNHNHPSKHSFGIPDNWRRHACKLLEDSRFAENLVTHCQNLYEKYACNWSHHNALLAIVLIVRCVYEHNDVGVKSEIVNILRNIRITCCEWIKEILEASNNSLSDDMKQYYRKERVDVAVIGTLTYGDDDFFLDLSDDSIAQWIHFRRTIFDNMHSLEQSELDEKYKNSWRRCQIYHAQSVADSMYHTLAHYVERDKTHLDNFLTSYWSGTIDFERVETSWKRCGTNDNKTDGWYYTELESESKRVTVHIDIINGSFLINGNSCNCLPKSITDHLVYKRVFGDSLFHVESVGEESYKTSLPVRGSYYVFQVDPSKLYPLITQLREDGRKFQLVPSATFVDAQNNSSDLPDELVQNYSHWLDIENISFPKIYFTPIRYDEQEISNSSFTGYTLDLKTNFVYNHKSSEHMIDVKSDTFTELAKIFTRLTPKGSIHVFATKWDNAMFGKVFVHLPKLRNIRFELNDSHRLVSVEYRGMEVSENQNFGSLIGLMNGLLLQGSQYQDRIFLCPHGQVIANRSEGTKIDVNNLRSPSFFKYVLREDLLDIRAEKERLAWEYLAQLHAQTSGLLPDPFTKCLGVSKGIF